MKGGLKLLAEDEEDLAVMSAHLQDAVLRVGDLAYLPKQRRFAAVVNRYCWEGCGDKDTGTRVQAGLHFDYVLRAQSSHVRQEDPAAILELLALRFTPGEGAGGSIDLLLAGGGRIRLDVECIEAQMRDLTAPRPAVARPGHDLEQS